jgi:hypothetical protein
MLQRSIHKSAQTFEADVRGWIEQWNSDPRPLAWKNTAEEILDSLPISATNFRRRTLAVVC